MSENLLPKHRFSDLERAELVNRLELLEDVRNTVVTRGKALIADPHYPNQQIVRQLSRLLAENLQS